jgi:hypothetical protein
MDLVLMYYTEALGHVLMCFTGVRTSAFLSPVQRTEKYSRVAIWAVQTIKQAAAMAIRPRLLAIHPLACN